MNLGDILVLAVLGLIIGAVIGKMYHDRKKGKSCSCGSCSGCSMGCSCQFRREEAARDCGGKKN